MEKLTCCFTDHRKLPQNKIAHIVKRLNDEIDNLYRQGVTSFISGGAIEFGQIAVSDKKVMFRRNTMMTA